MNNSQTTDILLLVRPFRFRKNEETAINNYFQEDIVGNDVAADAQREFDMLIKQLSDHKINTCVVQDEGLWDTPDSIFPNNGISFHGHTAVLYPMFANNRRRERQLPILKTLAEAAINFDKVIDYTFFEQENRFLEGTGSLVLDRVHCIAYCSLSPRAAIDIAQQFCTDMGYTLVAFEAYQTVDGTRKAIYHTNVMMSVGTQFAVVCLDSIDNIEQRISLVQHLKDSGKTILEISEEQLHAFAGNILEVKSTTDAPYIVMSSQAYHSFTVDQRQTLSTWGTIIHTPLTTIETAGGGSARCMIAEIF